MLKRRLAYSIAVTCVAYYVVGCSDSSNQLQVTSHIDGSPRAISAGPIDVHAELVLTSNVPDIGASMALDDALLTNGDLEQGAESWFDCKGSTGSSIITDASSGGSALAVPPGSCVYNATISVSAGDAIVLTCDTKLSESGKWAGLGLGFSSAQWEAVGNAPTTLVTSSELTQYSVSATVPNDTRYTSLWFYSGSAATIDNCELKLEQAGNSTVTRPEREPNPQASISVSGESISTDENLLSNPGFLASVSGTGITDWFVGCSASGVAQGNSTGGLELAGSACVAQSFSAEILGALRGNRYSFQCITDDNTSTEYADVVISLNGVEITESNAENGLTNISGRAPDNLSTGLVTVYSEYPNTDPLNIESCSLTVENPDKTDIVVTDPTEQATVQEVYNYYLTAADTISIDRKVGDGWVFFTQVTAPAGVEFLDLFPSSNPNEFSVKVKHTDTGVESLFYYTRSTEDSWELQPTTDTEVYNYYLIAADTIAIDRQVDDGWVYVTQVTAPAGVEFLNVFPGSNPNEFSVRIKHADTGVESVAYYARTGASSWALQPTTEVYEYITIAANAIAILQGVGDDSVYITDVTAPAGIEFLDVYPGSNPNEFSVKTKQINTGIEFTYFYGRTGEAEWTVLPTTTISTVFDYYAIAPDTIAIDQLAADGWVSITEVTAPEGAEFLNVYRGSDPEEFFVQTKVDGAELYSIYYYTRTDTNKWELQQIIEADSRQVRSLDYEPTYETFPTKIVTGGDIMVAATSLGVITDQSSRGSITANETYLDIYKKELGVWQHVTGVERVHPDNFNYISTFIVTADEIFLTTFTDSLTFRGVNPRTTGGENSEIAVLQRNEGGTDAWGVSQIISRPPELADFGRPLKLSDGVLRVGSAAGDATSEYRRISNGQWVLLSDDGQDISINGNFQNIDTDGVPAGWSVTCSGNSFNTVSVNGEQGVQLGNDTCADYSLDASAQAMLAGNSYKFGCRISESSGLPSIEIRFDQGSQDIVASTSDTVGTYITVQGNAPENFNDSTIQLASVNRTSFYDCRLSVW